jgi:putative Mg2+ transporter-C (MgtC) family protein
MRATVLMPLSPTWQDILLRLFLTVLAGALIGFDREARGHAAGLRTTILVALAAAIAMIQANILLPVSGKEAGSFAVMDLMRLPLGILTGVGFIGGGAILKQGGSVTGVTTAATLWIVTAIGLCFGGGQLLLGAIGTGLGLLTLGAAKWIDLRIRREHHATLVVASASGIAPADLAVLIAPHGYHARFWRQAQSSRGLEGEEAQTTFDIRWKQAEVDGVAPDILNILGAKFRIVSFELAK